MTPSEAQGAVGVVGTVAALGLFLPALDRVWEASPADPDTVQRVRVGQTLYLGTAAAVTLLAAYGQGNPAPFLFGFGLALVIVGVQEYGLRHRGDSQR